MYESHLKYIYDNGIKIQVDNQTLSLITSGFIHWIIAKIIVCKGKEKDNLVSKTTRMSGVLSVTYISFYKALLSSQNGPGNESCFLAGNPSANSCLTSCRYIQLLD